MRRNLLRFGLLFLVLCISLVSFAGTGGKTYTNETASVVWAFNNATDYATNYTKTPEDGFSMVNVNTGDLTVVAKTSTTTLDAKGNKMTMTAFNPKGTTKAVEWTVKPTKGLTFTPTSVSAYINRFGTDAETELP